MMNTLNVTTNCSTTIGGGITSSQSASYVSYASKITSSTKGVTSPPRTT